MDEPLAWVPGRHTGREAFRAAVRGAIVQAEAEAWPWMAWSDPDFRDWPLEEKAVVDGLHAWCLGGGRLRMLASDFAAAHATFARLVAWRRQWDHRVEARASGRQRRDETPTLLLTPQALLWRADPLHSACVVSDDRALVAQWRQTYESLWQQSIPAFAASTLGL